MGRGGGEEWEKGRGGGEEWEKGRGVGEGEGREKANIETALYTHQTVINEIHNHMDGQKSSSTQGTENIHFNIDKLIKQRCT